MSVFTGIAIYLTIWWTVLFSVLPIGVTSHAEAGIDQGCGQGRCWHGYLSCGAARRGPGAPSIASAHPCRAIRSFSKNNSCLSLNYLGFR